MVYHTEVRLSGPFGHVWPCFSSENHSTTLPYYFCFSLRNENPPESKGGSRDERTATTIDGPPPGGLPAAAEGLTSSRGREGAPRPPRRRPSLEKPP